MSRHVILLTDAHEAPAFDLIEALQAEFGFALVVATHDLNVAAHNMLEIFARVASSATPAPAITRRAPSLARPSLC